MTKEWRMKWLGNVVTVTDDGTAWIDYARHRHRYGHGRVSIPSYFFKENA